MTTQDPERPVERVCAPLGAISPFRQGEQPKAQRPPHRRKNRGVACARRAQRHALTLALPSFGRCMIVPAVTELCYRQPAHSRVGRSHGRRRDRPHNRPDCISGPPTSAPARRLLLRRDATTSGAHGLFPVQRAIRQNLVMIPREWRPVESRRSVSCPSVSPNSSRKTTCLATASRTVADGGMS